MRNPNYHQIEELLIAYDKQLKSFLDTQNATFELMTYYSIFKPGDIITEVHSIRHQPKAPMVVTDVVVREMGQYRIPTICYYYNLIRKSGKVTSDSKDRQPIAEFLVTSLEHYDQEREKFNKDITL